MGFPDAERFYSKLTHTSQSWLRTRTSLKMPSCKWCALPKSLTAHSDIRSQQNCPRHCNDSMNPFLIFVLHCHLNSRLPTTKRVGRQVRTVLPVDGSLHSLDTDAGGRQSHGVRPLAGIRVLVRRFLLRDAELGDELVDKPERGGTHRHNSLQGSRLPRCAV